jgi:uncharacterized protein
VRIILRWYPDSEVKNMKENRQRLAVVDGIRGCSLLGILLANMLIFQYGIWGKDELHLYAPSAVDVGAYALFGIYAAKARWFHEPDRERPFYRNGAILCLLPGVVLACAGYVWRDEAWSGTADVLGNSLLAFGYPFALAYVFSQAAWSTWLHRFASVGKLSMTNYLMQTVICTTIFYGYGLGLFGNIGVLAGILLAVAIFAVQAAGSHWYMRRFRCGPVEKLLRMWTNVSFSGRPKEKAAVGRGVTTSA